MPVALRLVLACVATLALTTANAQTNSPNYPTWWNKYQQLSIRGSAGNAGLLGLLSVGTNEDASNECGPQSETFITLNPIQPATLTAGSNEIFRLPMRGYFSTDNGSTWGGVDLPLPPAIVANGTRFGSDPSLAYDTIGNVFYSYIVVFFSNGKGKAINGTEIATARSGDGGATYPNVTYFSFSSGQNHFNDKPMIAADTNLDSAFRDNVYVAWDAASGGSSAGGIRVATSTDHGASFDVHRVDNPTGPGKAIGAVPFVGSQGEVYVAWNDYFASTIAFNRSFDGGNTWGTPTVISGQSLGFQALPPAQSFRGALLYPTCSADRSAGPHRDRLYCAWMDGTAQGTTDIVVSVSEDRGASWSAPVPVTDRLPFAVDRFFPWLSVDPVTGDVNVAFYDTRNDTTGFRYMTDVYLSQSQDGGVSWRTPNIRVSSVSSNEHDCAGVFRCNAIDYGNQYGDYLGLVSHGGVSHPVWTDSRRNQTAALGCPTDLLMEEVFTATVK
jgi:hypothetical protein